MEALIRAIRPGTAVAAFLLTCATIVPAAGHTVTVKLFRTDTLSGDEAEWVSGVQVALRAANYTDAGYRDTDWDGERTLSIPDDAIEPWFQWFKIGCEGGSALYDMTADQGTVYIPIDCPQHILTIRVYDEESWNGRTGRLLSGVSIRVDSPRYPYYFRSVDAVSDADGQTRLQLPPGDFQVELSRSDCTPAVTMIRNVTADRVEPLFIDCLDEPVHASDSAAGAGDLTIPGHR